MKPGGFLCIADLRQENGSFHAKYDDFFRNNGFDRELLCELLTNNGFRVEYDKSVLKLKNKLEVKPGNILCF